jgi:nucleoside 2-deoxyribosyltransferase
MKRIYLSGPIDHVSMDQAKGWREEAKNLLIDFEVIDALRGHGNWIEHPPEVNEVVIRDKNDLDTCDIVLVNMSKAVPMIGTPM